MSMCRLRLSSSKFAQLREAMGDTTFYGSEYHGQPWRLAQCFSKSAGPPFGRRQFGPKPPGGHPPRHVNWKLPLAIKRGDRQFGARDEAAPRQRIPSAFLILGRH
ncbi:hypothetical protein GPALN_014588 [Globodera pallida]|nr:hypothetical protein GPALN_014588 [Globodera pallida]